MTPFEERRRDPVITEEAYQDYLAATEDIFTDTTYVESRDQIKKVTNDLAAARRVSFHRVRSLIEDVWVRYSAGTPLMPLRERVKYVFEDLQRHNEAFPNDTFKLWEPDAYYFTMLLTSWTVLFNLPEYLNVLVAHISQAPEDGEDCFLHTLFRSLGIPDFPGKQAELLHEDPYGILYDSLTGNKEYQQKDMRTYLKRWYKSEAIKGCYWHGRHVFKPSVHLGYWAFETGMLTILNDLDDSGYRELDFYPRHMVDYCREQGWHKEIVERVQAIRDTRNGDPQTLRGNMQPFEERKRDPFITEEAYTACLKNAATMFTDKRFAENRDQIKKDKKDDPDAARRVSSYRSMIFIEEPWVRYSAGDPLGDVRERMKYAFEDMQRHIEAFPEDDYKLWEPDAYYYTMLLTSWSVLFNLPECLDILVENISQNPEDGEDSFIYTLFSALGVHDFPGKQAGLLHEDPYGILYDSLAGSKEDQQKAMKAYLKRWYKSKAIRGCYWRERHSFKPSVHRGYWAFEAGMLTIINDLDDSGYRDMPYYPRDMVDYCREQGWHKKIAERAQAIRGE